MIDRELMQQAHDALLNFENDISDAMFAALTTLRARLAQPEERLLTEAQALDIAQKLADCAVLGSVPPSGTTWQNAALCLGEELSTVGPDGYYNMTAQQWLDWAMKNVTPARLAQPEPDYEAEFIKDWNEGKVKRVSDGKRMVPEREWQGLTDEEVDNFAKAVWPREATSSDFIRAIEAKLKDKNT